jgi:hypothetical protein
VVPSRKPFLKRLVMFFKYLIRPVPGAFLLCAFAPQLTTTYKYNIAVHKWEYWPQEIYVVVIKLYPTVGRVHIANWINKTNQQRNHPKWFHMTTKQINESIHLHPLILAPGYPQLEHMVFCLWKEIFPHLRHPVWVLVCLRPKDCVPLVCKFQYIRKVSTQVEATKKGDT